MRSFSQQLKQGTERLKDCLIPQPRIESELLLSLVIEKPREFVLSHPEAEMSDIEIKRFESFVGRRANHEPFSHISGKKEFMGLDFIVTSDTLIPRPETELMVECAIQTIADLDEKDILITDVGTGSGCIAISATSLLKKNDLLSPKSNIIACDISSSALEICRKNIKEHSLDNFISISEGNLLEPVMGNALIENKEVLVILANLPYLSSEVYESCPKTVKNFEPKNALLSAEKGLSHYKELFGQMTEIKNSLPAIKIISFLEISPEQKSLIEKIIKEKFPNSEISFLRDLSGKWRLVRITI